MKIKVGIVGYGTIGKRVADAVLLQKDMELVGITGHSYNFRIEAAKKHGIEVYTIGDEIQFKKNNISVAGNFNDLLKKVDVIVDCSPKPFGADNKKKYIEAGVKGIYQGGEKADVGEVSFVAQCNYDEAVNKNHIRVVSCNTTGLARTIGAINKKHTIQRVRATLIRRATDPGEIKKGPINAIVPSLELPSHHGPDVRTVLHEIEVFTTAVVVPTTIMHMHNLSVDLKKDDISAEEILNIFREAPRIRIVSEDEGIESTAQIMEFARDLGYKRGDMMDICVWKEGIGVHGKELFFTQAVHQESDVIPENIDAIRAAMGFKDGKKSMEMTDKSLNIFDIKKKY